MRLPTALWGLFAVFAVLGLTTPNPLLTAASIIVLPVFMSLLWRPGETPVLLFAVTFQWLQVTATVFHANVLGLDVIEMSEYAIVDLPSVERAIWMGLIGLIILSVGMRIGMWKLKGIDRSRADEEVRAYSPMRAFMLYLALTSIAAVFTAGSWGPGIFRQVMQGIIGIKWAGFFILGYVVLKRKEGYPLLVIAILIEFIGGIGFFSGFKTVLFVTLIIIFTVRHKLQPMTVLGGVILLVALLIFGGAWTSVKPAYRDYLNQGSGKQVTVVSRQDQLSKLAEMVGELSWQEVGFSMGKLFGRISYVDYFALTMDYVPSTRPHEGGALWKKSVLHVLQPRAFFPNKPVLESDSELTMQYTGLKLASDGGGTSISIGYMGESYIDFGPYGMYVPVFILGVLWGLMYYFFLWRAKALLIGYAFATSLLLSAYQFEMASIKLLGGVTSRFLVLAVLLVVSEKYIVAWLEGKRTARAARPPAPELVH